MKISVFVADSSNYTADVYQSYPTWGYPVNEYVYYAISTGSNTVGSFSTLLIVSANNDTIITTVVSIPPFQHYVSSTVFPVIILLSSSTQYMNLVVILLNFNSFLMLLTTFTWL